MIYVKSFLTGLSALLVAALLGFALILLRIPMPSSEGNGYVVGGGGAVLAVSFLAFVAGFIWQYRKLR